jgi:hypothetical protein
VFIVFLAVICLWAIVQQGPHVVTVGVLVACAYLLLLPWERVWAAQRNYWVHEAEHLETRVSLAADRVSMENEAFRSDFGWVLVGVVADTLHGLLFCNRARQPLFWLPQRLLEGNYGREQVLDLAASNGVPVRRLP